MKFKYKAQMKDGAIVEGEGEASDKFVLARQLKAEGKIPLSVQEVKGGGLSSAEYFTRLFGSVRLREKIVFVRNLEAMLSAGLPLSRSLNLLKRQTKNKKFKAIIETLSQEITEGNPLSTAFGKFPRIFPLLLVAMVKVGEEGGNLPESFKIIGNYFEQTYLLERRVRGALIYPTIIIIAMIVIGILMLIYVVPTLTSTFEELGVELPISTQLIILFSDFLQNQTLLFLATVLTLGIVLFYALRSKKGKRLFESLKPQ